MELLFSNHSPLKTDCKSYTKTFEKLLGESNDVSIATGFFSTESIVDLKRIAEENPNLKLSVCIGMHYFSGVSPIQLQALKEFHDFIQNSGQGSVFMVTTFPYHGKLVSFASGDKYIGTLLGSSNLSNILEGSRQYEVDMLISEKAPQEKIKSFIDELISKSSSVLNELDIQPTEPENDLMVDQIGVDKIESSDVNKLFESGVEYEFDIPLKGDVSKKSGLNTYLGKGRKSVKGTVIPRSWYEVELIVPKTITESEGYPKTDENDGEFSVVTDDGWSFGCKVSGAYNKNLRSENDLKTLGKWLKGRMVNSGSLKPGDMVTDSTLQSYGRQTLTMKKYKNGVWYMDFSV